MYGRELAFDQPYENTSDCCLTRLNTKEKRRTRRGLMDKMQGYLYIADTIEYDTVYWAFPKIRLNKEESSHT
jgi:hypothetical protein